MLIQCCVPAGLIFFIQRACSQGHLTAQVVVVISVFGLLDIIYSIEHKVHCFGFLDS